MGAIHDYIYFKLPSNQLSYFQQWLLEYKNVCTEDDGSGVLHGSSTTNRIERLWRTFKTQNVPRLKDQLAWLADNGLYDSTDEDDRTLLTEIFLPLVQRVCNSFVEQWNSHRYVLIGTSSPL